MDDPRLQEFFANPQFPQQRRYEAIRAAVIERQPLQEVAKRFGFAYGTLRNLISQFRTCIRHGQIPPFSLGVPMEDRQPILLDLAPTNPPSPTVAYSPWTVHVPFIRAWRGSSCSCHCRRNLALTALFTRPVIPVPK
jgi:hypothetical protein